MRKNVKFRDCVKRKNKIYFFDEVSFLPMMLNLENYSCKILPIHNKGDYRKKAIDLVEYVNNSIYALEMGGEYLCEYNLETKKIKYIRIDCAFREDANFALSKAIENKIYIFAREKKFMVLNTLSNEISFYSYPSNVPNFVTGCVYKENIILLTANDNKIYCYNYIKNKWNLIYIDETFSNIRHIVSDDKYIYILCLDGSIFVYDLEHTDGRISKIKEYNLLNYSASRICLSCSKIIVLPALGDDIFIIEKKTGEAEKFRNYPKDYMYDDNNWIKFYGYCEDNEAYYFANRKSQYLVCVSKRESKIDCIKIDITEKEWYKYEKTEDVMNEKQNYLKWFIEDIKRGK